jgi:Methyltransferase domain
VSHQIGEFYTATPEAARIEQLHGDSLNFNPAPFRNKIDFCWVDASHQYEFVMQDSLAAIEMVRADGWIAWHDYRHNGPWAGVTRALRKLQQQFDLPIRHLSGTTIAVLHLSAALKQRVPTSRSDIPS